MFQKGDFIIYGYTGICRIADISAPKNVGPTQAGQLYYTLAPIHTSETIYIPVDTAAYMRPVVTRATAVALIASIPRIQAQPFTSRDLKELAACYRALLQTHACEDLIQLLKMIDAKEKLLITSGRRLGKIDTQYKKQAQELLFGELAAAMMQPYSEMEKFLESEIAGAVLSVQS